LVDKNGVRESVSLILCSPFYNWNKGKKENRIANNQPGRNLHGILEILVDKVILVDKIKYCLRFYFPVRLLAILTFGCQVKLCEYF